MKTKKINNEIIISPEVLEKLNLTMEKAQVISRELATAMQPALENIQKMQENLAPLIQELAEGFERFRKEAPESTKVMAEHGWYPTMHMMPGDTIALAEKIKNEEVDSVNLWMMVHLNEYYSILKKDVIKKFSHRNEPLKEAFWAHENKKFYLSVPVFLAQADGICQELTQFKLFGAKKIEKNVYKPYTEKWANQLSTDFITGILIEPLKHKGGLNKHRKEPKVDGLVTRHQVLHGESYDYGKEIHSYRALSLLYFVSEIVYKAKEKLSKKAKHS